MRITASSHDRRKPHVRVVYGVGFMEGTSLLDQRFIALPICRREAAEDDLFQRRWFADEFAHRLHGDLRGLICREAIDASGYAGEGDAGQLVLCGDAQ